MSNHTQDIFCSQYSCKFPVFCLKRHLLACKSKYFFFSKALRFDSNDKKSESLQGNFLASILCQQL